MENKQSDHMEEEWSGISHSAEFPQLPFTLKPFSRTRELSASGGIRPLCKHTPTRVQGYVLTCQLPC